MAEVEIISMLMPLAASVSNTVAAVPRPDAVDDLVADGLVVRRGDRVVLGDRGRMLADLVVRRLTA